MEFSAIRHLILCEVLISPVLGNLATCSSPDTLRGQTATIACRFEADINALHIDFQVDRYSLDPSDSIVETVLFCYWNDSVRSCKTANGYEYDKSVVDQFNITVPNAMKKHEGRYACQTSPSEPGEIQSCNLYINGNLATCSSPDTLRGQTATIACRFEADINALQIDFQVDRYSLDPSDSTVETVLFCYWNDGVRSCKTANGYEYDKSVVDQFNIKVPNAMKKHEGRYACQISPSEPGEIQSCNLHIIGNSAPCSSPDTLRGQTATIACRFEADINALQIDFQVDHFSLDLSKPFFETVLSCHWNNGTRSCKTANGYEYDKSVVDQFNIKVPNAMAKHEGQYECKTVDSEHGERHYCNLNIYGILTTCLSPAALSGETATINCSFDKDINALHKDFQVNRHSLDPSDSLSETVLSCHWNNSVRSCKTANGYDYDDSVVDQFIIKVPNAMAKHAGRYACQTVPSEPADIHKCYLYIIEPPEGYKTAVIVFSVIGGLAIVIFALYNKRKIFRCLRNKCPRIARRPRNYYDEEKSRPQDQLHPMIQRKFSK